MNCYCLRIFPQGYIPLFSTEYISARKFLQQRTLCLPMVEAVINSVWIEMINIQLTKCCRVRNRGALPKWYFSILRNIRVYVCQKLIYTATLRHKAISSWGCTPKILKMQRLRLQVANEHHYLNEKYIINGDWICAFLIGYDNVFSDLELRVFGSIFLYS